jgi:anti-anti-sigma factor
MSDRPPLPEPFRCEVLPGHGHVRVIPVGELDLATGPVLERTLRDLVESGFDRLVIDLRRLVFMDSSGLRLIMRIDEAARRDGTQLSLIAGPPAVQRVFETTGLLDRLTFVDPPRRDAALARRRPAGGPARVRDDRPARPADLRRAAAGRLSAAPSCAALRRGVPCCSLHAPDQDRRHHRPRLT